MANWQDYSLAESGCQFNYENIYLQNWYNVNMRPTTRLRILEHLRRQPTATAGDLSRSLGMTAANIRHHLAVLEANALVEVVGARHQGRGRPQQVYALSRHVLGDGLDDLAVALFDEWLGSLPPERQDAVLMQIAERLAGDISVSADIGSFPRRLAAVINRLNELHYQARWEAGAAGPRIILGHCPYAAIVSRVPCLCRIDALLLERLLHLPVRILSRMDAGGLVWQCVFQAAG